MNNIGILLFLAILPIIVILSIVYNKDKKKEPSILLIQLFISGIIASIMVAGISHFTSDLIPFMRKANKSVLELFLYSFIGIALVEELCKWIMLYIKGYHHKEFDETYDMIVYAVFVSLGFAFFENIIYILKIGKISTAIMRAVLSVPGHACDAIFMGYYLSIAKQHYYKKQKQKERKYILLSIIIPAVLHGVYDFCVMSKIRELIVVIIIFILIEIIYIFALKKLEEFSNKSKIIKKKITYCKKCGYKVDSKFCKKCGTEQE